MSSSRENGRRPTHSDQIAETLRNADAHVQENKRRWNSSEPDTSLVTRQETTLNPGEAVPITYTRTDGTAISGVIVPSRPETVLSFESIVHSKKP